MSAHKIKRGGNRLRQILLLTKNDIRNRFSGTLLGSLWPLVLPLVTILVLWYVYERGFRNPPVDKVPYILWFTSAYLPWIFFSDLLSGGCRCCLDYSFLITKIPFPAFLLPLIRALTSLFYHLVFLALLCSVLLLKGLAGPCFLQLPLYCLLLFIFGLGLSLLLSVCTVLFRDLEALVQGFLQVGFWASPVLWDPAGLADPGIRRLLSLNPLSFILEGYRDSLLGRGAVWERKEAGILFLLVTGVIWLLALCVYKSERPVLADRLQ